MELSPDPLPGETGNMHQRIFAFYFMYWGEWELHALFSEGVYKPLVSLSRFTININGHAIIITMYVLVNMQVIQNSGAVVK